MCTRHILRYHSQEILYFRALTVSETGLATEQVNLEDCICVFDKCGACLNLKHTQTTLVRISPAI